MPSKDRTPKSLEQKLLDLDAHLYLLREHLHKLRDSASHLKVIAAELRTLVCRSSGTEGLLWRLTKELGVPDDVALHVPGKLKQDDPLVRGLEFMIVPIFRAGKGDPRLVPGNYSLQEVIKEDEALVAVGKPLTHEYLIKAVAQQMGSAHEDEGLELALAQLSTIFINGERRTLTSLPQMRSSHWRSANESWKRLKLGTNFGDQPTATITAISLSLSVCRGSSISLAACSFSDSIRTFAQSALPVSLHQLVSCFSWRSGSESSQNFLHRIRLQRTLDRTLSPCFRTAQGRARHVRSQLMGRAPLNSASSVGSMPRSCCWRKSLTLTKTFLDSGSCSRSSGSCRPRTFGNCWTFLQADMVSGSTPVSWRLRVRSQNDA